MGEELKEIRTRYEKIYLNLTILAGIEENHYQDYSSVESVIGKILANTDNSTDLMGLAKEIKIEIEKLRKRELEILKTLH